MKPPAICSKAPPSMRITNCGRGFPGHQTPGSNCQITFNDIPVFAIDSMMTQGIVSNAPIAVMARIDHQGVCVGHAVTPTMDMTKPNAKMMLYCPELGMPIVRNSDGRVAIQMCWWCRGGGYPHRLLIREMALMSGRLLPIGWIHVDAVQCHNTGSLVPRSGGLIFILPRCCAVPDVDCRVPTWQVDSSLSSRKLCVRL